MQDTSLNDGRIRDMTKALAISWKRAAGLSCLAVFGPFIVMAIYTLLFVSCSHCKRTAWTLLPCAPGLLPIEAGRRLLDLSRPADGINFALAFIVSLAMIFTLACLLRRGRRLRFAGVSVALAVFSIFAFCTLSMIRS
jgi:hypothetical protein